MTKKEYCMTHAPIGTHSYYDIDIHGILYGIDDYVMVADTSHHWEDVRDINKIHQVCITTYHRCKLYYNQEQDVYFKLNGIRYYIREFMARNNASMMLI